MIIAIIDENSANIAYVKNEILASNKILKKHPQFITASDGNQVSMKLKFQQADYVIIGNKIQNKPFKTVITELFSQQLITPEKIIILGYDLSQDDLKWAIEKRIKNILINPKSTKSAIQQKLESLLFPINK